MFGKGKFKICQVINIFPDEHGHVRSVEVEMRPTNNKEAVSKKLVTKFVTVQWLVMLYRPGVKKMIELVRAECVCQRNEVAIILGIISLSLLSPGFLL